MHSAPAIVCQQTEAQRVARVRATFAILDAEQFKAKKKAQRELDALAAAGRLGAPDTIHTIRTQAAQATGLIYDAPYFLLPPAANVKMQARRDRAIWPGARTREADYKSYAKRWPKLSDKERKVQENLPVRQVAAPDEL